MRHVLGSVAALLVPVGCGARTSLALVVHPPPVDPSWVRACVMYESCGGDAGLFKPADGQGVSKCLAQNDALESVEPGEIDTGFLDVTSIACLAAARDCTGVATCVYGSPEPCLRPPGNAFCRGDFAVHCIQPGLDSAEDCASAGFLRDPGATCLKGDSGNAECGFGRCGTAPSAACDGNVALQCSDGVLLRWTCPSGSHCGPDPSNPGAGTCIGDGAPCTADRCDGSDAIWCVEQREWRLACGHLPIPGACTLDDAGVASCAPEPDLACDPSQYLDHCDGARLVYCDGDEREIDCTTLGFTGCGPVQSWTGCR